MARYSVDHKVPEQPMTVFVWTERTVALMEYTGKGQFVSRTPKGIVDRTDEVFFWEHARSEPIRKPARQDAPQNEPGAEG